MKDAATLDMKASTLSQSKDFMSGDIKSICLLTAKKIAKRQTADNMSTP
jgi:hypothetical protein